MIGCAHQQQQQWEAPDDAREERSGRTAVTSPLCESHGSVRSGDGPEDRAARHINGGKK